MMADGSSLDHGLSYRRGRSGRGQRNGGVWLWGVDAVNLGVCDFGHGRGGARWGLVPVIVNCTRFVLF